MQGKTVTLVLEGDISLPKFAAAVVHFNGLVAALTEELGGGRTVAWKLDSLDVGSALASARAESDDTDAVDRIVRGFDVVGEALWEHKIIPFSRKVAKEAHQIADVLGQDVEAIRFETEERSILITDAEKGPGSSVQPLVSYGAVKGRVQTLSNRGGLRFTLFDTLDDRAVNCYLQPGEDERMRGLWGTLAIVEGRVSRDPITARPFAVRQIANITPLLEVPPGSYTAARGAVPRLDGALSAEDAVRRVRDSWPSRG